MQDKIYGRRAKKELIGSCFLPSHPTYKVIPPNYAVSNWGFCQGNIKAEAMSLLLPQAPKPLSFSHLFYIFAVLFYSLLQVFWVTAGFLWVWSSCDGYGGCAFGCTVSSSWYTEFYWEWSPSESSSKCMHMDHWEGTVTNNSDHLAQTNRAS